MNRRMFLRAISGVGAASIALAGKRRAWAQTSDKPDIVLIMADDMGYSDIGCYGGEIRTPNLDNLSDGGLRFTQFYNAGRCCPTRASLMTGLYPHQAGVGRMMNDLGHDGYRGDLNEHCLTIAQVLKMAGYGTYMSGKWHVTKQIGHWYGIEALTSKHNWPRQRGFDRFFGTIHAAGSFFDPVTLTLDNDPIDANSDPFYYTDAISDFAAQSIRQHHQDKAGEPLFCYVAYTAPHWPLHALPEDIARYKGRYDGGWDALRKQRYQRMVEMGLLNPNWKLSPRDARVMPWKEEPDKEWQARRMEVYAAQVDRMDQGIGRVIDALKETGRFENTLIFFLADNGAADEEIGNPWEGLHVPKQQRNGDPVVVGNVDHSIMPGPESTYQSYGIPWANASNTPFRWYKHYVHEGGIATPLIVHWPKRIDARGEFRRQPSHLIDIMATCVDVGRADYPKNFAGHPITPLEGKSLLAAFDDKPITREALYFEHEGNRAIRQDNWKLVAKGWTARWELYDLEADRSELNNLAAENPEHVRRMATAWVAWAKRAKVLPWP